MILQTKL